MRLSIWEPGLHCTNIAVKTSLALQIVCSMVSKWCWCSLRVSLRYFIKISKNFQGQWLRFCWFSQPSFYISVNQLEVWLLTSVLRGLWKPGIKNCKFGNEGSRFVSAMQKISILPATNSQRFSNLFLIEFMFK